MDSTFVMPSSLTLINLGLALYSLVSFGKIVVQFGLPNHPAKFLTYVTCLCVVTYFGWASLVGLSLAGPFEWMRWRSLPMVIGSLALLVQVVTLAGSFSLIQQKVISRIPLIAGLLCLSFFPTVSEYFVALSLGAGSLFLTALVGKARYQKRLFFKMCFFVLLFWLLSLINIYGLYVVGEALLFAALFYFFIFESTFAVMSVTDLSKET